MPRRIPDVRQAPSTYRGTMIVKPALLVAAVAAIAAPSVGAVATIAATPAAGTFQGTTSQRHAISFTVSPTRRSIGRKSTLLDIHCPDGFIINFTISKPLPVRIVRGAFKGSWSGKSRQLSLPYTVQFAGRFASTKRASGTIQIVLQYSQHGGACRSGVVAWSARHR